MVSPDERVIIEFVKVGAYVKVSAIDPTTRVEVSIVGDPLVSQAKLEQTAVQKLKYVLNKRKKREGAFQKESGDIMAIKFSSRF